MCFFSVIHFHPNQIFGIELQASFYVLHHSKGRLLVLPSSIKLGQKWSIVTNVLAYHIAVLITAVKGFIVRAPDLNVKAVFCSVIETQV